MITTLLTVGVLLQLGSDLDSAYYAQPATSQCGINALYMCLRYLGTNLPMEQVYSEVERNDENQVNLGQLAQCARAHGVIVKSVRNPTVRTLQKWLDSNSAAVLQFKFPDRPPHMVALLRPQEGDVILVDIPHSRFPLSDQEVKGFLSNSEGLLLLSRKPPTADMIHDLGKSQYLWLAVCAAGLGVALVTALSTLRHKKLRRAPTHTLGPGDIQTH